MNPMALAKAALPSLLLAMAAATPVRPEAVAEVFWRGPVHLRSQFPLDLPTLDLTADQARLLPRGQVSLEIQVVHSNTFEITPSYDTRASDFDAGKFHPGYDFNVDGETTRTSVRLAWGVSKHVQLGFEAVMIAQEAGFLDRLIDDVHDTLGLPTNDRDSKPRDVLNMDVIAGARRKRLTHSDSALGDLVAQGKFRLFRGARTAVSAVVEAKAPIGDEDALAGSGAWDYGLTVLVSTGGRHHRLNAGAGHFWLGQPDDYPFEIEDRTSAMIGYEWRPNERWSLDSHVMAANSILPEASGDRHNDKPRAELVVGVRRGGRAWHAYGGFVENLTTNDNTADLGLFFGVGWAL